MRRARVLLLMMMLAAPGGTRGEEPWVERAFIPSAGNVHGEVRLLRQGEGCCLQTLLYSRFLRRGLYEMAKQERLAWPEGYYCHGDSTNYLRDLAFARDAVLGSAATERAEGEATNRVARLLIEMVQRPGWNGYVFARMDLEGPPESLRVIRRETLVEREAHPFYVSRAFELMAGESLAAAGQDADVLLRRAGWAPAAPPALPEAEQVVPR